MAELKTSVAGGVATVLFSNLPKMNAMSYDMWQAVPKVFAQLDADPAVRLVVCAGDGCCGQSGARYADRHGNRS